MPSQATAYKIGMLKILELREKGEKAARPEVRSPAIPRSGAHKWIGPARCARRAGEQMGEIEGFRLVCRTATILFGTSEALLQHGRVARSARQGMSRGGCL
jgi:hypothetical protein